MKNIKSFNESLDSEGLIKDMKSMDLHKEFNQLKDYEIEEWTDLVRDILGEETLFCTRTWSAWGHGTMTEGDFIPSQEDDEYVMDKAEYLYNKLLGK